MQFTGDGDTHTEACFNTEAASKSGAAANSAASFDATADPYRFAASDAGATRVGCSSLSD
ncbi:MAG: hypothetical protein DMG13_32885 [Acidobacteria bacterium]|nr:MAG: hypothetical protein DMG13_32885 [Acidobacteriota bacterium]